MFALLVLELLEKFNFEIDKNNVKKFIKKLKEIEEEEHRNFLKNLEATLEHFDKLNAKERQERLDYIRSLNDE
jgi:Asp-tRNA(Asn)/Glu-tRNA(Gln) amidotransferase C subunit